MKSQITATFVTRCFGTALIVGAMFANPTFAAQPGEFPSKIVKFADLNLNSPEGVAALSKRIHRAAEQLCEPSVNNRELGMIVSSRKCVAESETRAVKDVNNAALTGYYMAKNGTSKTVLAFNTK